MVTVDGRSWSQVTVAWGDRTLIQLATRFEDGVTLTLDAPLDALDPEGLAEIAASIA